VLPLYAPATRACRAPKKRCKRRCVRFGFARECEPDLDVERRIRNRNRTRSARLRRNEPGRQNRDAEPRRNGERQVRHVSERGVQGKVEAAVVDGVLQEPAVRARLLADKDVFAAQIGEPQLVRRGETMPYRHENDEPLAIEFGKSERRIRARRPRADRKRDLFGA
jgi:hypothetical protein